MHDCEFCGGSLFPLGALGRMWHYRCRNCGMEAASELGPEIEDEEPEDRYVYQRRAKSKPAYDRHGGRVSR